MGGGGGGGVDLFFSENNFSLNFLFSKCPIYGNSLYVFVMHQLIRFIYVSACQRQFVGCAGILKKERFVTITGFYTKLNVWGSLGLNFEYDGGPIIEIGGPIFLYKLRILEGSTSFREGSVLSPGQ